MDRAFGVNVILYLLKLPDMAEYSLILFISSEK